MYEIQKDQSVPVKFFAGEYPVVTAVKAVATGKSVKQYEPVKLTDNGIEPVVKVAASEAVSGTSTPVKSEYENTTAGKERAEWAAGRVIAVGDSVSCYNPALNRVNGVKVRCS